MASAPVPDTVILRPGRPGGQVTASTQDTDSAEELGRTPSQGTGQGTMPVAAPIQATLSLRLEELYPALQATTSRTVLPWIDISGYRATAEQVLSSAALPVHQVSRPACLPPG